MWTMFLLGLAILGWPFKSKRLEAENAVKRSAAHTREYATVVEVIRDQLLGNGLVVLADLLDI